MASRRRTPGTGTRESGGASPPADRATAVPVRAATCAVCSKPHPMCYGAGCVAFDLQRRRITVAELEATVAGLRQQVAATALRRDQAGVKAGHSASLRVQLAALRRRGEDARAAVECGRELLHEARDVVAASAAQLRASLARLAALRKADTEGGVMYEPVLDALDDVASEQTQAAAAAVSAYTGEVGALLATASGAEGGPWQKGYEHYILALPPLEAGLELSDMAQIIMTLARRLGCALPHPVRIAGADSSIRTAATGAAPDCGVPSRDGGGDASTDAHARARDTMPMIEEGIWADEQGSEQEQRRSFTREAHDVPVQGDTWIPLVPASPEELSVTMELLAQDVLTVLDSLGVRPSRRLMAATVGRDGAQLSALLTLLFRTLQRAAQRSGRVATPSATPGHAVAPAHGSQMPDSGHGHVAASPAPRDVSIGSRGGERDAGERVSDGRAVGDSAAFDSYAATGSQRYDGGAFAASPVSPAGPGATAAPSMDPVHARPPHVPLRRSPGGRGTLPPAPAMHHAPHVWRGAGSPTPGVASSTRFTRAPRRGGAMAAMTAQHRAPASSHIQQGWAAAQAVPAAHGDWPPVAWHTQGTAQRGGSGTGTVSAAMARAYGAHVAPVHDRAGAAAEGTHLPPHAHAQAHVRHGASHRDGVASNATAGRLLRGVHDRERVGTQPGVHVPAAAARGRVGASAAAAAVAGRRVPRDHHDAGP